MKWLLDTNVISESVRAQPDRHVLAWLAAQSVDDLAISAVTLAELVDGAMRASPERRALLLKWIEEEVGSEFAERTLPVTVEVLTDWLVLGRRLMAKGRPQTAPDLLIASTARVHGLIIASRNHQDFAECGVTLFDPWTGKTHRMDDE